MNVSIIEAAHPDYDLEVFVDVYLNKQDAINEVVRLLRVEADECGEVDDEGNLNNPITFTEVSAEQTLIEMGISSYYVTEKTAK